MRIENSGMKVNSNDNSNGNNMGNKTITINADELLSNQKDSVDISEQGVKMSYEIQKQELQEQAEAAKKSGDGFKNLAKLMEIARRIAKGDHVPSKDEMALMEYNKNLYMAAKAAASLSTEKKHKNYKSVFDEDEDESDMRHKLEDLENEDSSSEINTDSAADTSADTSEA